MDLVGHQIGSYVAKKLLGSGGMGAVYLCDHTLIDRQVAVKVLHDEHAADTEQIERFFQEARAAAGIGHPNIITIIDVGYYPTPSGQRAWVMMEALDGQSLDKRLRKGGLDLDQMRHVMLQCASALAASHGKGIIHRDLKPANVFLCKQQFDPLFVKVLDFGIAKLTTPGLDGRKTQTGMVLGTPHYMSPEQCEGKGATDHRSDIYSLGVMLYEMLTGTLPFDGDIRDILLAHITQEPEPPSRRNPAIPPAWEALCLRMIERAKEARPQSMNELALALGDLEHHAQIYAAAKAQRAASGKSGHTLIAQAPSLNTSADGVPRPVADATSRPTLRGNLDELMAPDAPGAWSTGAMRAVRAAAPPRPGPDVAGIPPASDLYRTSIPTSGYGDSGGHPQPGSGSGGYPVQPGSGSGGYPVQPGSGGYPTPSGPVATVPAPATAERPAPTSGRFAAPAASGGFGLQLLAAHCEALATDPHCQRFVDHLFQQPRGDWADVRALCAASALPPPPPGVEVVAAWLEHPHDEPRFASIVFFTPLTMWSTVIVRLRPA